MLPILAIATTAKGYIFPICISLIYTFFGFFLMTVNEYLHPLNSAAVIIMGNTGMPGVTFTQAVNLPKAFLCICIWDVFAVLLAAVSVRKK
jgi:bacitracin transport system permease protein